MTGQALVGVQFYALKRVLRGIELLPEKIEVFGGSDSNSSSLFGGGNNTGGNDSSYTLRIISRIAFEFWDPKR